MDVPMPPEVDTYTDKKWGIYGELGSGGNVRVRFIQTALKDTELDSIRLISDIPGSEKWPIKDLFQREVNQSRVSSDIIPYLKNDEEIKFFNPLTLIVLPMSRNTQAIQKQLDFIEEIESSEGYVIEKDTYFKFHIQKNMDYAFIEWDRNKCHLVAVDGQHRLSALKRIKSEPVTAKSPENNIHNWKIPVVILVLAKKTDESEVNVLESVRRTFININKKAEKINRSREILLNDEDVIDVCTQEILEVCHENDLNIEKNNNILPLIFFNWRGVSDKSKRIENVGFKTVLEINELLKNYILLPDGRNENISMRLNLIDNPISSNYESLSPKDTAIVREEFNTQIRDGLLHFISELTPYKKYIKQIRELENQNTTDDVFLHAYYYLKFGNHNAEDQIKELVEEKINILVLEISTIQDSLPNLLSKDIGLRGLFFAFSELYDRFLDIYRDNSLPRFSMLDFSSLIIMYFNQCIEDGWFNKDNARAKKYLTGVIYDNNSHDIINYKYEHAKKGLGSFLVLLVFSKIRNEYVDKSNNNFDSPITEENVEDIWNEYSSNIESSIIAGYKKVHKAKLSPSWEGTLQSLNTKSKELAIIDSNKYFDKLKEYLSF